PAWAGGPVRRGGSAPRRSSPSTWRARCWRRRRRGSSLHLEMLHEAAFGGEGRADGLGVRGVAREDDGATAAAGARELGAERAGGAGRAHDLVERRRGEPELGEVGVVLVHGAAERLEIAFGDGARGLVHEAGDAIE